nr:MAG TPA: hypothetical protein [Caudoviricetes sp.]
MIVISSTDTPSIIVDTSTFAVAYDVIPPVTAISPSNHNTPSFS